MTKKILRVKAPAETKRAPGTNGVKPKTPRLLGQFLETSRQTRAFDTEIKKRTGGFNGRQCVIIFQVGHNPGVLQSALIPLASSDRSTVNTSIKILMNRGIVSKRRHPGDRRATYVTLTLAGKRTFDPIA